MATRYPAVIFDVDGTLVESNDAHARAWVDALTEAGYPVDLDRIRRMIGMGGDRIVEAVTGTDRDARRTRKITERRSQIFCARYLPSVAALPGARALVSTLRGDGRKLAIASAARAGELEPLLHRAGIATLVPARTSSSDVDESKPDPEIVCAALARLGTPARGTVMIGDTPYDVAAANGAGVATIGVTSGGWSRDELIGAGAIAVYRDPADLLAHRDRSPLARDAR